MIHIITMKTWQKFYNIKDAIQLIVVFGNFTLSSIQVSEEFIKGCKCTYDGPKTAVDMNVKLRNFLSDWIAFYFT